MSKQLPFLPPIDYHDVGRSSGINPTTSTSTELDEDSAAALAGAHRPTPTTLMAAMSLNAGLTLPPSLFQADDILIVTQLSRRNTTDPQDQRRQLLQILNEAIEILDMGPFNIRSSGPSPGGRYSLQSEYRQ